MTKRNVEKKKDLSKSSSERKKSETEENAESKQFYGECKALYKSSKALVSHFKAILVTIKDGDQVEENFSSDIELVASIVEGMRKVDVFQMGHPTTEIESHKMSLWKSRLLFKKLAVSKLANDLVLQLLDSPMVECALRLAHLCNEIMSLNLSGDPRSINVFSNACPMLLYPLRKLSMARILQILAAKRAEACSFNLILHLVNNYFEPEGDLVEGAEEYLANGYEKEAPKGESAGKLLLGQNSASSNTSVEIYRALTRDLESKAKEVEGEELGGESIDGLWRIEEKRVRALLALSARVAPQLLGTNSIVPSKTSGEPRVATSVKSKLAHYYQQVLWGEVGGYLEHILLWWNVDPLGSFPPPLCQSLKDYIAELKASDSIPVLLVPSINSLLDAMCCHLTSTSWDQLFRKTLVSSGNVKRDVYKGYGIEGSATGQLFVEMFADLVRLSNSCENVNLGLEELPLVEHIPILHRLDHSVHTVRMWSSNRCRNLAAKWDLDDFYCTCHTDISRCLEILNTLKLRNHEEIPANTSVQVTVCVKMRAKLVSEIKENVEKLKRTASECIEVLAKNCRTECLAILHMCFPKPGYWRQSGPFPDCASEYVEKYLDSVLRPVFIATHKMSSNIQLSSSAMVLRILCESWLEYVYLHRIKFTEWGAVQLLTDFGAVPTWMMERVQLPKNLLDSLVSHEVLRRCEGVGRLLLRRRGESIRMTTALPVHKSAEEESSADNMPAEMYVPNQEQWLDLRAPVSNNICCRL